MEAIMHPETLEAYGYVSLILLMIGAFLLAGCVATHFKFQCRGDDGRYESCK